MLRGVLAIVGLIVGMALMAVPAAAHATDKRAPVADRSDVAQAGAPTATVAETAHDHAAVHDHETAPLHSHAPGEDTYHQKASHCSLDFAHVQKPVLLGRIAASYEYTAFTAESVRGIVVTPPVPPPLA